MLPWRKPYRRRNAARSSYFMREINRANCILSKFSAITLAISEDQTGHIDGTTGIPVGIGT